MSERKWTPGPWAVRDARGIRGANGECVASTYCAAPAEDAHLIAAAPDLYEALKRAAMWIEAGNDRTGPVLRQCYAALDKARGEA